MNKRQKEVIKFNIKTEESLLKTLEDIYRTASLECSLKIKRLEERKDLENIQSIIYQKTYQEMLKAQIDGIADALRDNAYTTIDQYLRDCYENGYIGSMYDIAGQGIPIISPINQDRVAKAAQINPKLNTTLYEKMGVDVDKLKKDIRREVSIGIARGKTWKQVGEMIALDMATPHKAALSKAQTIARTEGHRIHNIAQQEAMEAAEQNGADVVKQWNSILDDRTRTTHQMLDGKIVPVSAFFEIDGKKAYYPGGFGRPEEDINCRCVMLQRAVWALDEEELETLRERAEYFGLDKTKDFETFKAKYLKASEKSN